MIRPTALKSGANIGVISPSYWITEDVLKNTAEIFTSRNFHLTFGKSIKAKEGPFAGPPELRAEDLNNMFADPNIDAIFCARGGYGANRVLPLLNYDLIKENPKIFIGYSDVTAYLTSITQKTEIITFHGPMESDNFCFLSNRCEVSGNVTIANKYLGIFFNQIIIQQWQNTICSIATPSTKDGIYIWISKHIV